MVQKKFWSKKNFGPKKICVQKKFGSKKEFWVKKNCCFCEKFSVPKNAWVGKILRPKIFSPQKYSGSEKYLGSKKICESKQFWFQKISGLRQILSKKKQAQICAEGCEEEYITQIF